MRSYVLPIITLGFSYFGFAMQAVRATTLQALGGSNADLVFPGNDIGDEDAVQNAILPTVAKSGLQIGWLLLGVILVEVVFAFPGIGRLALEGIYNRDTAVAVGSMMRLYVLLLITGAVVCLAFAGLAHVLREKLGGNAK